MPLMTPTLCLGELQFDRRKHLERGSDLEGPMPSGTIVQKLHLGFLPQSIPDI